MIHARDEIGADSVSRDHGLARVAARDRAPSVTVIDL
jgi:hypothetical protein